MINVWVSSFLDFVQKTNFHCCGFWERILRYCPLRVDLWANLMNFHSVMLSDFLSFLRKSWNSMLICSLKDNSGGFGREKVPLSSAPPSLFFAFFSAHGARRAWRIGGFQFPSFLSSLVLDLVWYSNFEKLHFWSWIS